MNKVILFAAVLFGQSVFAQVPVQPSCGPAGSLYPVNDSVTVGTANAFNSSIFRGGDVSGSRRQLLITRDELRAMGFINGVIHGFAVQVTSNQPVKYRNFKVSIGCVDTNVTGLNQFYPVPAVVFSSDSIDPPRGWFNFAFSGNGYAWDGRTNLIIETCYSNPSLGSPVEDTLAGTNVANFAWIVNVNNGSSPCSSTNGQFTFNFRPLFRLRVSKSDSLAPIPVQTTCGTPTGICQAASSVAEVGTGLFPAANPFRNTGVSGTRRQFIFSKTELEQAGFSNGIIKSISIKVKSQDTLQYRNFRISMGCGGVSDSVLNGFSDINRVVFQSPSVDPDSGWYKFELSGNGYAWAGTGALLIQTCFSNSFNGTREDTLFSTLFGPGVFKVWASNASNGTNGCTNGSNSFGFNARPVFRFGVCSPGSVTETSTILPGLSEGTIYPNPGFGSFNLTGFSFPMEIQVWDKQGRRIEEKHVENAHEARIDLREAGMYFVKVTTGARAKNFKVLVSK